MPKPFASLVAVSLLGALAAQDRVDGLLLEFRDNGAWSWFEDERAIVDELRGRILVGSVGDSSGIGGAARAGDIDLSWLDVSAGRFGHFLLHDGLEGDDHDSPALLQRPDGSYLAAWCKHGGDTLTRYRSSSSGDAMSWSGIATFGHGAGVTYSNLFHLPANGRVYDFCRALNYDPNVAWSDDLGATWTAGGKLLSEGGGSDRPYVKYASDGHGRVHLLTSNRHPRNFDNGIFHGYVENDRLHDSFGNVVDANVLDGAGTPPAGLTPLLLAGTPFGGVPMRRGWTIDLTVDPGGVVRALFQARANGSTADHRLFFGRFDGVHWQVHEVCALGGYLYAAEDDYTGLAALHPDRADTIYVSTRIHPQTGVTSAHYELFAGSTPDGGASWSWRQITNDSSVDNLRPIVPRWRAERTALLWFRGTYTTYTDWDCAVVGCIEAPELTVGALTYHDATPTNTTLADGSPVVRTGPSSAMGPTDGQWHERASYGNGGSVWTSSESAAEDAPLLRTRVAGLPQRAHDVFVLLWSNPNEDWRLQAGFAPGALRNHQKRGCAMADPARFTAPLTVDIASTRCYLAWIGRAVPDQNGDLDVYVDDLVDGALGARTWYDGVAIAEVAAPATQLEVGSGCNGNAALDVLTPAVLGGTMTLVVTGAAPASFAAVQVGTGELVAVPLGILGVPQCTLYVGSTNSASLGLIDGLGSSPPLAVPVPNNPLFHGVRLGLQGWTFGAAGLQMSPAVVVMPGM